MTEDRARRLVSAFVSAAVILLVLLLTILVFQMVCLKQKERELNDLRREERLLEEQKQNGENEIELWLQEWKIKEAARKLGYRDAND